MGKRWLRRRLARIETKLDLILTDIALLHQQGERIVALADDLKAAIANLNNETNANAASLDAVQANITQLASRIKNSLTDQEVAEITAGLTGTSDLLVAESARLKSLAQDPTNPVPPVPPPLTALRTKHKK